MTVEGLLTSSTQLTSSMSTEPAQELLEYGARLALQIQPGMAGAVNAEQDCPSQNRWKD